MIRDKHNVRDALPTNENHSASSEKLPAAISKLLGTQHRYPGYAIEFNHGGIYPAIT